MSSCSDFDEGYDTRFLLPQGVGDTEDVERYEPGGFHPVHLGDRYDGGRYRVVHKLGAGIMTSGAICWRHCPRYQNTKLLCSTPYDLLSKIFVYNPTSRLTAREMLDHPWFRLNGSNHVI